MTREDDTKFDVRVRERHLKSGVVSDSEIAKHIENLTDVGEQAVSVTIKQPALQSESDRDIVIVRTSGMRPPPTLPRLDDDLETTPIEDDDDLDDDLDDEDDDEEEKKEAKPATEKKPAAEDKPAETSKPEKAEKAEKEVDDDWGAEP